MCVSDFSPGISNHLIEKKSVAMTITAVAEMIRKSQLLWGPVPCVIPFKYLGCATSQGGQANTIKPDDNNAKLNSAFFIVINFIY